jgi:hypothetical protein
MGSVIPVRLLHLRSWSDAEGFAWSDLCGCDQQEDHEGVFPEHEATRPVGQWGEDYVTSLCRCDIGEDHDTMRDRQLSTVIHRGWVAVPCQGCETALTDGDDDSYCGTCA